MITILKVPNKTQASTYFVKGLPKKFVFKKRFKIYIDGRTIPFEIGIHNKGTSKKLASARVQGSLKSERCTAEEPCASITPSMGGVAAESTGVAYPLTPKDASSFWTKPHCNGT